MDLKLRTVDAITHILAFRSKYLWPASCAYSLADSDIIASLRVCRRRCLPYLKYVRGIGWERKHWTQLFSMLKLITKVSNPKKSVSISMQAMVKTGVRVYWHFCLLNAPQQCVVFLWWSPAALGQPQHCTWVW